MESKDKYPLGTPLPENFLINFFRINALLGKRAFYINEYKQYFLEDLKNEYNMLKTKFPQFDIKPKARIKSKSSFDNKAGGKVKSDNFEDIYDIFGVKYILHSVDGKTDEETLINGIKDLVYYLSYGIKNLEIARYRIKDYISHPKKTSYKAFHITRSRYIPKKKSKYQFETQILTTSMNDNNCFGEASHVNTYKTRIPGKTDIPDILEYVFDDNGFCIEVRSLPKDQAYKAFFGIPLSTNEKPFEK